MPYRLAQPGGAFNAVGLLHSRHVHLGGGFQDAGELRLTLDGIRAPLRQRMHRRDAKLAFHGMTVEDRLVQQHANFPIFW